MAIKLSLTPVVVNPIVVNPRGTINSLTHRQVMKEKGLYKHMASAYIIAYRGLKVIRNHEK